MSYANYRQNVVEWYQKRLSRHDTNVQILSSGTEARRSVRFSVLTDVDIQPGSRVLDVGCGFADLLAFLEARGIQVDYTGVDVVPEFVESARDRFPGADIQLRDILDHPFAPGSFDFVICSQVLNLKFANHDNVDFAKKMLKAMHMTARHAISCDFMTSYVDFVEPSLNYYSPQEMFDYAKTLTKRVTLRHDYPLFEFCLYLFPDFHGWQDTEGERR